MYFVDALKFINEELKTNGNLEEIFGKFPWYYFKKMQ